MIDIDDSVLEEREYKKGFSDGKMRTYQQGSDFAEEMGVKFGNQFGKVERTKMKLKCHFKLPCGMSDSAIRNAALDVN